MAVFVPSPNVVRVVHRMDRAGFPMYNVMYHDAGGVPSGAQLTAIAETLGTLYINTILEQLANVLNYEECVTYSMQSETAPTGAWSAPDPSPGGITSEGCARGSAPVVTLRTANRGRSSRGRSYLPGAAEANISNGVLDSGYMASLETAYENYRTGAAAEELPLLVYSQYTGGGPRVAGVPQLVLSVEIRSATLGSQRRRNHRP